MASDQPHSLPHQRSSSGQSPAVDRSDTLWPWYAVTVVYVGVGLLVLYDRAGEFGSLFDPASANSGRLPLNSIGDVLAGFFAPLAFLWLFAATQLQRKELQLQREELADTRAVLNEQRIELERSAAESNAQTAIMQKTLESSRYKEAYDEFSLKLYYHARFCLLSNCDIIYKSINTASSVQTTTFNLPQNYRVSQIDPSTVDDFYEKFMYFYKQLANTYGNFSIDQIHSNYLKVRSIFVSTIEFIDEVENDIVSTELSLIKSRFEYLDLPALREILSDVVGATNRS